MAQPIAKRISREIDRVVQLGVTPKILIMTLLDYQELCAWMAAEEGREHLEVVTEYRGCQVVAVTTPDVLEAVPEIREMWEAGERFLAPQAASTPKAEPREDVTFAEL